MAIRYLTTYCSYQDPLASYHIPYLNDFFESGPLYHHVHEIVFSIVACEVLSLVADCLVRHFCTEEVKRTNEEYNSRTRKKIKERFPNKGSKRQTLTTPNCATFSSLTKIDVSNVRLQFVSFVWLPIFAILTIPLFNDPILNTLSSDSSRIIPPNSGTSPLMGAVSATSQAVAAVVGASTASFTSYIGSSSNAEFSTPADKGSVDHQPHSLGFHAINAYTPYAGFVCAVALGYHLWLAIHFFYRMSFLGILFAIYQTLLAIMHFIYIQPFLLNYLWCAMLVQLSTLFLNIRWFYLIFPNCFHPLARSINDFLVVVSFFALRIFWVPCLMWKIGWHFYYNWEWISNGPAGNYVSMAVLSACVVGIYVLDLFWFNILVKVVSFECFSNLGWSTGSKNSDAEDQRGSQDLATSQGPTYLNHSNNAAAANSPDFTTFHEEKFPQQYHALFNEAGDDFEANIARRGSGLGNNIVINITGPRDDEERSRYGIQDEAHSRGSSIDGSVDDNGLERDRTGAFKSGLFSSDNDSDTGSFKSDVSHSDISHSDLSQ